MPRASVSGPLWAAAREAFQDDVPLHGTPQATAGRPLSVIAEVGAPGLRLTRRVDHETGVRVLGMDLATGLGVPVSHTWRFASGAHGRQRIAEPSAKEEHVSCSPPSTGRIHGGRGEREGMSLGDVGGHDPRRDGAATVPWDTAMTVAAGRVVERSEWLLGRGQIG